MHITLYEFPPTRSSRVRWALNEAGLEFDAKSDRALVGSEELKKIHPQGKVPAVVIDGKPLFESAAICTHVADLVPAKNLIAPSGTWERALHNQWTCFGLTEMEAYLWSTARNSFILPEADRITAVYEQNAASFSDAADKLDTVLDNSEYLIGDRFSVTDIIMGFTINWAKSQELLGSFSNLQAYLARLCAREHCPYGE